ncbi:MAG TPA: hypothetical protein VKA60_00630 [Blastocatellia bacterium]|nr:hypothetical protein [Blastocatellia bacterium]
MKRGAWRLIAAVTIALTWLLLAGCGGGKPFNVKSDVTLPALAAAPVADASGVRMQAAAVRDEDYLLATFDANLILAGVLPVNLAVANQTAAPIDLRKARFAVRSPDGHVYKAADAKHAFARLIKYYGISTYNKSGYKKSREDFAAYAFDTAKPLAMGESRQGMLFFIVPDGVTGAAGLKLIGARLGAADSVELHLN